MSVRLTSDLEAQINKRKKELEILTAAFDLIQRNGSIDSEVVEVKRAYTKRGTKLGSKRGPYNTHIKKGSISKSYRRKLKSPNWRQAIPPVLKSSGRALTTREIASLITPGLHKKAMSVQVARCSAALYSLKGDNIVQFNKLPGSPTTYSLA